MPRIVFLPLLCAIAAGTLPAQWTPMSPASQPAARAGHAMAAHPFVDAALLFGGAGGFNTYNDTWRYDGTTWTQLFPATSPSYKFYTGLAYDLVRGVHVLYGGNATYTSQGVDETWEFDGATWTQRFPATNPGRLGGHAMVYDLGRNRVVLYGGIKTVGPIVDSNETWEYDGVDWVNRAPATNPGRLEHHSMCYHYGVGKTILFGGVNANPSTPPTNVYNDKTWAYDGFTNTWTELTVTGARPNKRERATLAYDAVRDVCVLTGGLRGGSGQAESGTWELQVTGTTGTWTLVDNPATGGRLNSAMVFLIGERHMVRFGGSNAAGGVQYQETLEWGAQNIAYGSGCPGSNGVPVLSANDAPRLGQSWTVTAANLNPGLNLAVLVFGFTQLPGIDLGPLLDMPGCLAFTTPDATVGIAGAGGAASWLWPSVGGALGDTFYCQAMSYDPGVNGFDFTVSNAILSRLGW
ncbi:MAG: hypothetical protein JNM25_03775 [Planctomycetes bacterium]|nr:hypothetical protein [Planctomycetota bacterium]